MANKFYITAGLPPIDNSDSGTTNSFYATAGLVPDDTAEVGEVTIPVFAHYYNQMRS